MHSPKKIVILYRVVHGWRAPIFEKLNKFNDINIHVWSGPDFKGTKLISTKKKFNFHRKKLISFKLRLKSINGLIALPISPFLFFNLVINKPDVIITEGASNLFNSIIGFIYCKIFGKKFIWWSLGKIYNRTYDPKRKSIDRIIQYIERNSNAIITYSSLGEEYFKSIGVREDRIFKAINVVDTERIINDITNSELISKPSDFVILFVGALEKEKEVQKLLSAFAIIEKEFSNVSLFIVGDGSYRKNLVQLSKELNLNNVTFTGKVIDKNYIYFRMADIFVLPGLGGLAISEAMCYGLPVICTTADGTESDLVKDNGILDRNLTVDNLVKHIKYLMQNSELREEMGRKAKDYILKNYNTNSYISQIRNAIFS